jgi:tRNA(Ile2) C34 agmatinyltransferase TiaS
MEAKQRSCLKCGKSFESAGPGNRICTRCAQINSRISISEAELQKQRGVKRRNGDVLSDLADDETSEWKP